MSEIHCKPRQISHSAARYCSDRDSSPEFPGDTMFQKMFFQLLQDCSCFFGVDEKILFQVYVYVLHFSTDRHAGFVELHCITFIMFGACSVYGS